MVEAMVCDLLQHVSQTLWRPDTNRYAPVTLPICVVPRVLWTFLILPLKLRGKVCLPEAIEPVPAKMRFASQVRVHFHECIRFFLSPLFARFIEAAYVDQILINALAQLLQCKGFILTAIIKADRPYPSSGDFGAASIPVIERYSRVFGISSDCTFYELTHALF